MCHSSVLQSFNFLGLWSRSMLTSQSHTEQTHYTIVNEQFTREKVKLALLKDDCGVLPLVKAATKILPAPSYRGVIKTINLFIDLWLRCLLYLVDKIHELLECVHCLRYSLIGDAEEGSRVKEHLSDLWLLCSSFRLKRNNCLLY